MTKITLIIALTTTVFAKIIPVSSSQFTSEDFVKSFTGSYGILSPVEPKVSRDENELLGDVADLFGQGQFRSAESKLVDFIKEKRNPSDGSEPAEVSAALVFVLGNLYFQNDRPKDAIRSYKLAIKKFPKFRRAFKNLALLYASQDQYDLALPNLKQAVQLGDADHRIYGLLGYCYLSQSKSLASEGAYRQAFLLNPDERDWKLGLAQALLMQEKWQESAALLNELIDENPDNPQLWMQQANCYLGLEDHMRAAKNFEILRLKGLADASTLSLLGNIYLDNEQPALALGAYVSALEKQEKPNLEQALDTAKILVDFGAAEQADEYLVKIASYDLSNEQKVRELLIRKGLAMARGNEEKVEGYLTAAKTIDPANGDVIIALGRLYSERAKTALDEKEKAGFSAEAKKQFALALHKESVKYEANLRYGQLQVTMQEYESALSYLNTALEIKPSDNLKQYIRRVERAAKRDAEKKKNS